MSDLVDVIIPLQDGGSEHRNEELRYLLRSIEAFGGNNINRVIVVTGGPASEWHCAEAFAGVTWIDTELDFCGNCKDTNIAAKLLRGAEESRCRRVVWTCDDCALLRPCDLAALPLIQSPRTIEQLLRICDNGAGTKWQKRLLRTMGLLPPAVASAGMFDTHTPQVFDRVEMIAALGRYPFGVDGYTINTYLAALCPSALRRPTARMDDVKLTLEKSDQLMKSIPLAAERGKSFLGYNDIYWGVFRGWADGMFQFFSGYERRYA